MTHTQSITHTPLTFRALRRMFHYWCGHMFSASIGDGVSLVCLTQHSSVHLFWPLSAHLCACVCITTHRKEKTRQRQTTNPKQERTSRDTKPKSLCKQQVSLPQKDFLICLVCQYLFPGTWMENKSYQSNIRFLRKLKLSGSTRRKGWNIKVFSNKNWRTRAAIFLLITF